MQRDYDRLDKTNTQIRGENQKLKRQIEEYETTGRQMAQDLSRLQSDRARLQVLVDQKDKEIVHLRDPDKDMTHNLKVLNEEVTMLRTQTRRLHEEKGLLKSRSQKIESTLDESQKVKNKMMVERDALFKENQELKQRYRKLALSNPKQRTLPDILSGSNGPSSRAGSRANSRIRNSDDSRLSPAREEEEDKYYR
ncbi:uncharacterized protein LOC118478479 [Aplysia californica]|uniref:Uncharacterized protein LOC118478479 n=1 Tax=Aplysia californica TaxID=6500 RepID=A0ABM1W066_APLCA|nr:uncharacterized protein LOC118478479 [Aplysia californica]